MGRFSRVALLSLSCTLGACSKSKPSEPAALPAVARSTAPTTETAESLYDAQGRLKPSSEKVDWLQIPMGFQKKPMLDPRRVRFVSGPLPFAKVRDFLAARMFTGAVEEGRQRVFYRSVVPLEADPKAVNLNILLSEQPALHSLVLEIERLTYGDVKPISVDEARRVLSEERAHAE